MKTKLIKVFVILSIIWIGACTILKRNDHETEIRAFLANFENTLEASDELILRQFKTKQSKEAIISAIRVLQNQDMNGFVCKANFASATISVENEGIRVDVPVELVADTLDLDIVKTTSLTLWLKPSRDNVFITRLQGEEFYSAFLSMKGEVESLEEEAYEVAHYEVYYQTAQSLQQTYDTVVWFCRYQHKAYYYVVNGEWIQGMENPENYSMGLVDEHGKVIIPVAYDLVGTINAVGPDLVEVNQDGLTGYYTLQGDSLVAPVYEWIIPYDKGFVFALVKADSIYGWLNRKYEFQPGFLTPEIKQYVTNFEFFPNNLTINSSNYSLNEIPAEGYNGIGTFIPPSYLTAFGLFEKVMQGFVISGVDGYMMGGTESVEVSHSFIESVTEKVNAVLTTINSRYLGGRQSFYGHNEITFVDEQGTAIGSMEDIVLGEISFSMMDSTLLEMKIIPTSESDYFEEPGEGEYNLPQYVYYMVNDNGGSLSRLESNRDFKFTEFVKINDSYISGEFSVYNSETQQMETSFFLSHATLTHMRDEILASYGFIFQDEEVNQHFRYYKWYRPYSESMETVRESMTEIDRYNLEFLNQQLEATPESPS